MDTSSSEKGRIRIRLKELKTPAYRLRLGLKSDGSYGAHYSQRSIWDKSLNEIKDESLFWLKTHKGSTLLLGLAGAFLLYRFRLLKPALKLVLTSSLVQSGLSQFGKSSSTKDELI